MSKVPFSCMIFRNLFQKLPNKYTVKFNFNLIVLFVLILGLNNVYSQKITYPKHQIGVGYSSFSGTGINYQIEIDRLNVLQFSGIVYYFGDNPPDDLDLYAILGGEYQYNIFKTDTKRIYVFAGLSILQLEKHRTKTSVINDVKIVEKNVLEDRIYNTGLGLGFEYRPVPQFAIGFNAGLLYQISDKADFSEYWDRNPLGETFSGIGIGISLRYIF